MNISISFCLIDIFSDFFGIELGKKILAVLDRETLVQLVHSPYFDHPLADDIVQDMATKGVVIRNKVQVIASHADPMKNLWRPKVPVMSSVENSGWWTATSANFLSVVDLGIMRTCILEKWPCILMERKRFSPS